MKKYFAILAVVIAVIWGMCFMVKEASKGRDAYLASIVESGKQAKRAGVPANANPYIGSRDGARWLNGWMEEAEKQ
jgi:uncharacterized protein YxeA